MTELWPRWATEPVTVVVYDSEWRWRGLRETARLDELLVPWLVQPAEHVGSTAVPGLAAKPIIDIQAPVEDLDCAVNVAALLAPYGWHMVPPELDARPWRRLLVLVEDDKRAAHLHLVLAGNPRLREQIMFRDALRRDKGLRTEYAKLKLTLAAEYVGDREAYTSGKAEFIAHVLRGRETT